MLAKGSRSLFSERFPAIIDTIIVGSIADSLNIVQKGDQIIQVDGAEITSFPQFRDILFRARGSSVNMLIDRKGEVISVKAPIDSAYGLGVYSFPKNHLETRKIEYGFLESFPAGISEGAEYLVTYVRQLKLMFTKQGVKEVGGFGTIAGLFGETWDWYRFWTMTALLSIILAVMNLLPIPALDGGHVMFLLYEMVSGRTPNQKILEYAQLVGFAILITLLLYANGNDVVKSDWFQSLFG
jgi:regulator of sigma E protease